VLFLLNSWLSKIVEKLFCYHQIFARKCKKNRVKNSDKKFWRKTDILSAHNFRRQKFAIVCWNSVRNLQRLSENFNFLSRLLFLTPPTF